MRAAGLFVAERFDRIEACGLARRPYSEDQTYRDRNHKTSYDSPCRNGCRQGGNQRDDDIAGADSQDDSENPAYSGESHGLEKKLEDNIAPGGANRFPNADLPRPFRYRNQHDVHHADAANQESDARYSDGYKADGSRDGIELRNDTIRGRKVERAG